MITSSSNPLLKRIRRLRSRKHRQREGVFFVEGIQTVWQAVRNRADIEAIVLAPDLLRSERALRMVLDRESQGTKLITVGTDAFASIAERENPSGLGALVRSQAATLDHLERDPTSLYVALDRVEKPGNVGSIIRSVDAVGGAGVIVIGQATDPYHPTAVKASMGTLFSVPVAEAENVDELIDWAAAHAIRVVATSAHAHTNYWNASYELPTVLLFGNEGVGLGDAVLGREDVTSVAIPMSGTATSLNLAVAVGVFLYEVRRHNSAR
jgi:RNA methyltransferase, TrmH family